MQPLDFRSVPGLQDEKKKLLGMRTRGRLLHAYLFSSWPGNAATPLAMALMRYNSCEEPINDDACGTCDACVRIDRGTHPDVHFFYPMALSSGSQEKKEQSRLHTLALWQDFIRAHPYGTYEAWCDWFNKATRTAQIAQKALIIGKEQIHHLLRVCALKPYLAQQKYLFVWLPETMHSAALNALLKTLEDPPDRTYFIFVTHAIHVLLPTLQSRLHTLNVRPFWQEEVASHLVAQGVDSAKASSVASLCDGVMHTALTHAFSPQDLVPLNTFYAWWRSCWKGKYSVLMPIVRDFCDLDRVQRLAWLHHALRTVHLCLCFEAGVHDLFVLQKEEERFISGLSKVIGLRRMAWVYGRFNEAITQLEQHAEPRLLFLQLSITLCDFFSLIRSQTPSVEQ